MRNFKKNIAWRINHLFFPHQGNNHRAKLLHHSSLSFLILLFLFFGMLVKTVSIANPSVLGISYSLSATELLNLTNIEREKRGLPPLVLNQKLNKAADFKAKDMFKKDYWAHFAPDGTSPWSFLKSAGYDYVYAGENLARGFTNSQEVLAAWMASPTHKENILSPKYQEVGFAIQEGRLLGENTILIVEMFGSTKEGIAQPVITQRKQAVSSKAASTVNTYPAGIAGLRINNPLLDSVSVSKIGLFAVFAILCLAFIIDFIMLERKNVARFIGHNLDHIILIGIFLLSVMLLRWHSIL
jgi:uncharacterized protein YkwD